MADNEQQEIQQVEDNLILIILVTNSISAFSAILVIFSFIKFKELQTFAFKIVLFLNISDLILAISNMIGLTEGTEEKNTIICLIQSYSVNASQLSSIIWTAIIAYILYQSCINNRNEENLNYYRYLFFGFWLPAVFSIYPYFTRDYGFAGISCWIVYDIDNPLRSKIIRYINFYIPLMIIILFNSIVYLRIICKLYGVTSDQKKFIIKMISYPFILIICWIFTAFNRTYQEIQNEQNYWLLYTSKALSGLMGFFNCIGYGFTPQVKDSLKLFCCVRRNKTATIELQQKIENQANVTDNSDDGGSSRSSIDSNMRNSLNKSNIFDFI